MVHNQHIFPAPRTFPQKIKEVNKIYATHDAAFTQPTYRTPWAELLRRTFHLEMTRCPRCYGYLKVIAVITQAPVIDKMLNHVLRKRRAPP